MEQNRRAHTNSHNVAVEETSYIPLNERHLEKQSPSKVRTGMTSVVSRVRQALTGLVLGAHLELVFQMCMSFRELG